MLVFKNADLDQNGVLNATEFWSVLQSDMLHLNLSDDELREIRHHADIDSDGNITYEEFIPVIKDLLQRVYQVTNRTSRPKAAKEYNSCSAGISHHIHTTPIPQNKEEDWNDWCQVGVVRVPASVGVPPFKRMRPTNLFPTLSDPDCRPRNGPAPLHEQAHWCNAAKAAGQLQ